jgi:hypothetical protein
MKWLQRCCYMASIQRLMAHRGTMIPFWDVYSAGSYALNACARRAFSLEARPRPAITSHTPPGRPPTAVRDERAGANGRGGARLSDAGWPGHAWAACCRSVQPQIRRRRSLVGGLSKGWDLARRARSATQGEAGRFRMIRSHEASRSFTCSIDRSSQIWASSRAQTVVIDSDACAGTVTPRGVRRRSTGGNHTLPH